MEGHSRATDAAASGGANQGTDHDHGFRKGKKRVKPGREGWKRKGKRPALLSDRAWTCAEEDHCETPLAAFRDLRPALRSVAKLCHKDCAKVRIYDPFYCEGSMKDHMNSLGFSNVYNENEDFYERVRTETVPPYDVLVSNPPFSGNHVEGILRFAVKSRRPFALLLPDFVCRKVYFQEIVAGGTPIALIAPTEPYRFWAPGRADKGIRGRAIVPKAHGLEFGCVWVCCFWSFQKKVIRWWRKGERSESFCKLYTSANDLPQTSTTKKRGNPRQRAKARKRMALAASKG